MDGRLATGLENKGVIVTGAAGGIGRAIVAAFEAVGARVCAVDLKQTDVEEVVGQLALPERHMAVGVDLADVRAHAGLIASVRERFTRFDALIHVAALLIRRRNILEFTEEDWNAQIDVNLKATFFLNLEAAKAFRAQGQGGRIVNFTSTSWWTGGLSVALPYAASKGGVVSLSRGFARFLAKDGITVNSVAPGGIDTEMFRNGLPDDQHSDFVATIPLGRLGRPEEVAGAVVFLASDLASYITGTTLNVSGGQIMY